MAFKNALGGRINLLPPGSKFTPTTEQQRVKDAADKVFAGHRRLRASRYAGLRLEQKEEIARQTDREQEDSRRWAAEQKGIAAGWARWCRWHDVPSAVADRYRAEHVDESGGDRAWLIEFGSLKSVAGIKIPGRLEKPKPKATA
jgi:hypothetical protein